MLKHPARRWPRYNDEMKQSWKLSRKKLFVTRDDDNNNLVDSEFSDDSNNEKDGRALKDDQDVLQISNWTCPMCNDDADDDPFDADDNNRKSSDSSPEAAAAAALSASSAAAAESLDGRLLCASQCAYEIKQPYFRGASYTSGTTVKRLSKGVNSVLIGRTSDGIVLAFRGTISKSPLDWLQNAALYLSDTGPTKVGIRGRVHSGYWRAVRSLWDPIQSVVNDLLFDAKANAQPTNVYLTGHSKGGALASIAAILMKRSDTMPDPMHVATFASARFGDSVFKKAFDAEIDQTTYEAYLDIIPFLPPSALTMELMESMDDDDMMEMIDGILWTNPKSKRKKVAWDYQPVGSRKYIDAEANIQSADYDDGNADLDIKRIQDIEEKSFLSLQTFLAAHCSACPNTNDQCDGLYFSAVAREVCQKC